MSTIIQQPDSISFSGNLKKFIVSSTENVSFRLTFQEETIFDEVYLPDNNLVEIDLRSYIDRLLTVVLPQAGLLTEQSGAVAQFSAIIDTVTVSFKVVKGGVEDMQGLATDFFDTHFLSWQLREKTILQTQPEWVTLYAVEDRQIKVKAYFQDLTNETINLTAGTTAGKGWSINVSWATVNEALTKKNPVAWDVWMCDSEGNSLSYAQRYRLRNRSNSENVFVWLNTLGGIDSVSMTGYCENDAKVEHQLAELYDQSYDQYSASLNREITQNTGYFPTREMQWLDDFFYSTKRYIVTAGGNLRAIVVMESSTVRSSIDDIHAVEFTYRYASEKVLLNLEIATGPLPDPLLPSGFFLTELLSGLPVALYNQALLMAVQSPFAPGWQQLSFAQLWGAALPTLIDQQSIRYVDGKLQAMAQIDLIALKEYIDSLIPADNGDTVDTSSGYVSGAIIWTGGLKWKTVNFKYKILGVLYTCTDREIDAEPADANLFRLDQFVGDTFSNVELRAGEPSANPQSPAIGATEIGFNLVSIAPGALEPSNVDIDRVYDDHTAEEWAATASSDTNISVNLDSTDSTFSGTKCAKVTIAVPDEVVSYPVHYIGEKYQGGRIFYLIPGTGGKKGYISAEQDTAVDVFWSRLSDYSSYRTGASGVAIGTGKLNTQKMLAVAAAAGQAVKFVNELVIDGYDDWFMPSEKELYEMYLRRFEIGNFGNRTYWSSTEITGSQDWKRAREINFSSGVATTRDKNNRYYVRAIREFDDTLLPTNQPVEAYTPTNTSIVFEAPDAVAVQDGIISLNISSDKPWRANSILMVEAYNGAVRIGSTAISPAIGLFGYKPYDTEWQTVAIQMFNLIPSQSTFDALKFSLTGSWPNNINIKLDDIRYQHSEIESDLMTPGTYGGSEKSLVVTYNAQGKATAAEEVPNVPANGTVSTAKIQDEAVIGEKLGSDVIQRFVDIETTIGDVATVLDIING